MNYKLFFKYILFHTNQIFLKYISKNEKNLNVYITENNFYYLCLHIKLSSLFYSTQLIEIFSYELPYNTNLPLKKKSKISLTSPSLLVYNFHSLIFEQRFFIFLLLNNNRNLNKNSIQWTSVTSVTELFSNANWLEREASELHGIFFSGKKDLRNLMLQYGDTSAPMRKSFPSIGLREIFYDAITDLLVQNPISVQF